MQVPGLLQEYKGCLATRKFDEAEKINKEINDFVTNDINTTEEELTSFGDDLVDEADRFEESIPVYFAAASLLRESVGSGWWWDGLNRANMWMIERDVTMKDVVKRHVIPLMHDIKNQILEMTSVSEEDKCWCMSRALRSIAESEKLAGDDVAAKEAREESRVWWGRWREGVVECCEGSEGGK